MQEDGGTWYHRLYFTLCFTAKRKITRISHRLSILNFSISYLNLHLTVINTWPKDEKKKKKDDDHAETEGCSCTDRFSILTLLGGAWIPWKGRFS